MGYLDSLNITGSTLTTERFRMDTIMQNLINQNTTRTAEGGPCVRKQAVLRENTLDFRNELGKATTKAEGGGVYVEEVVENRSPLVPVYDPDHPNADGNGYVTMPNVNNAEEMVDLVAATRTYETNVATFNIAKNMALKTLEIGKQTKRQKEKEGDQEWLNTYAGAITLILTSFVLSYSVSSVDISRLGEIASAVQRQLGIGSQTELEDVPDNPKYPTIGGSADEPSQAMTGSQNTQASAREMRQVSRDIQTYFGSKDLDAIVSNMENAACIRSKNDLLLDPDSTNLRDSSRSMLGAVRVMLQERRDNILAIYVGRHTARATNSLINDRVLSPERANNVAIYLEEQVGLSSEKLIYRGYGEYYPIADNTTKEGQKQNRQVDIIILGNGYKPPESVEEVETMDPLFPAVMPQDEVMMQGGTTSD